MYFVKMFSLSPPWGSSKAIKTNTLCFSKIAKIIFVFIVSLNFLSKSKIIHANSPDREKMLFYQALALQVRCAPIKNAGLSPSFFDLHLKTTVVKRANTNCNAHHRFVLSDENLFSR